MRKYKRSLSIKNTLEKNSFFLFGPRSIGKSFLIAEELPEVLTFDLLDDDIFERLQRRPKQLAEEIPAGCKFVVIDEIQKLPKLLDEVHRLIESRNLNFLLTGSSARKLKRSGANMLGGRAWEAHLMPLTMHEIDDFDLLKYFNRGGIPRIYQSNNPEEDLKAYVRLYIHEEIKAEAAARNIDNFVRFMEVIALSNGKELHYQNLSNESGVPPRTIEKYVEVLKDTLIGFELTPFTKTKKRQAISRAKFYFFDIAVVNQITQRGQVTMNSPLFGECFEHFLILECRAYLSYTRQDFSMHYWRSYDKKEVDLIIGNKLAIEFKSSKQVTSAHLTSLKSLREEGLIKKYAIVSQDPIKREIDGILVIPWQDFLQELPQLLA